MGADTGVKLIEASGTQILPQTHDERATTTAWAASQCCSADQRRHPEYAALATRLFVRPAWRAHDRDSRPERTPAP